MTVRWGAIVAAAGVGRRFGRPKQLVDLGGRPVVAWSCGVFAGMPEIAVVAVVAEAREQQAFAAALEPAFKGRRPLFVPGGATRQESVFAGLQALRGQVDAVLVHDGARPFVRADDVRRAMLPVAPGRAAFLARPVVDTVKVVDADGVALRTLDRGALWSAQTPQCARYADLERAHREAARDAYVGTDEAELLERVGVACVAVPGASENFKITVPGDLALAQALLRERAPLPPEEEAVYLVEAFIPGDVVDALIDEVEAGGGDLDGIDRELPQGVALRAYLAASALPRFQARFHLVAGHAATYTTRISHGIAKA